MQIKDQLNRNIQLNHTPKKIVSLVPSQTELVVDLGLEKELLGVTKFCVHPETLLKQKTVVGGTKQVHYDKIRKLNPDIILCNKEENTKEMISELEKIAPVHISDVSNMSDAIELINRYGELFLVEKVAQNLVKDIQRKFHDFKTFISGRPILKVAYFIWRKPWMVVANNTFINEMLKINNFENSLGNLNRYPEIDLEVLKVNAPELILLSSEPYPFNQEHKSLLSKEFPKSKVLIVDGELFSWYGSRLLKSFDYFKKLHQNDLT